MGGGQKRRWNGKGKGKGGGGGGKGKKGKSGGGGKYGGNAEKRRRSSGPLPERAVIVSSNSPSLCSKATREAVRLLKDALDHLAPKPVVAEETAEGDTANNRSAGSGGVCSALEAELAELREDGGGGGAGKGKGKPNPRRIALHSEVTRGIALIALPGPGTSSSSSAKAKKSDGDDDNEEVEDDDKEDEDKKDDAASAEASLPPPSSLVRRVFELHSDPSDSAPVARFVVRMLPLDFICSPHLKPFQAKVAAHLPGALADAKEGASWNLQFQNRAMSTLKRDDVLKTIKEIVKPLNLDLSVCDAEYTIYVEVNPMVCGFSVLKGYEEILHECNLQALCNSLGRTAESDEDDEDEDDEEQDDEEDKQVEVEAEEKAQEAAA